MLAQNSWSTSSTLMAMALPALAVRVERLLGGCVERDVVDPPRQAGGGVDVDREVVADLGVVELPEGDHALVGRVAERATRVVEEVLRVPAVLARVGGRHDLHELEAHHLGVEAVGGLGVTGGECDVVESHGRQSRAPS